MYLVAEQIKHLRERRKELLQKRADYNTYLETRDRTGYDSIGMPQYGDIQSDMSYQSYFKELKEIEETLGRSTFKQDRNFEVIDLGTLFTVSFEGEDTEEIMLVEKGIFHDGIRMVSLDSDLGKAVQGHKGGDEISYHVSATGRKINIRIDEVSNLRNAYEHFIREKASKTRMSKRVRKDLKEINDNDPEEYRRRHMVTPSQVYIAQEELGKIRQNTKDPSEITRRTFLNKMIQPSNITTPPEDDRIGIGSHVEIMLQDEEGNVREMSFELINYAISTELESHYVERITPLGNAIFGL